MSPSLAMLCQVEVEPGLHDLCCHRLALEIWNITSLVEKELELVWDVEHYQLDKVGLTYTVI